MRRWATLLPVAALLLPGLTACSADDPAQAGPPRPQDAEKGEKVDVEAFLDELEGSFDDGATAHVTFAVTGQVKLHGRGSVEYGDDGMDVDLRLADWQPGGGTVDLRTVGDATYMRVPESRGLWVAIGADDLGLTDSVLQDADPRAQLDGARDEITEVRYSGEDTLAGATVRRYQVVAKVAASAAPGGERPRGDRLLVRHRRSRRTTVGRPRRVGVRLVHLGRLGHAGRHRGAARDPHHHGARAGEAAPPAICRLMRTRPHSP